MDLPVVSVVIPALDEEAHIRDCLDSVLAQDYPAELIEVIVADGGSSDRTREVVSEYTRLDPRFRLIDNPRRNQAAGLNLAIGISHGKVVARLDAHAAWYPGHLSTCVGLLRVQGASSVGGTMEATGKTSTQKAFAAATRSPFGVGGASYRYSDTERFVDTVFLGCFRREALELAGPFNEAFPPHEDYELNYRLRSAGGTILFSPALPTRYWVRGSWRSLARQFFRYGRAKARVAATVPGVVKPYHLVPPAMVVIAAAGLPALSSAGSGRRAYVGGALVYLTVCTVAGVVVSRAEEGRVRIRTPAVFPVLHASWGLGFLMGLTERFRSRDLSARSMRGRRVWSARG